MKQKILILLISFFSCLVLGKLFIKLFKKIKLFQPVYEYVSEHKGKRGTPTMGGLFFILPSVIISFLFFGTKSVLAKTTLLLIIAFLIIGFLDDYIKIKYKKNEGLKPYQKIIFQLFVSLFAGIYVYKIGLTYFYIPFSTSYINLNIATVFIVVFIYVATTNCVNLTDGLDGLCGNVSLVYLIIISALIILQKNTIINLNETDNLLIINFALIGGILAFLCYNTNRASVFMGDTGSLSIGSAVSSVSIFSMNSFFIPIIGIMFVVSGISVIIQVSYYKKTKKRVFLKAPFHHHLQLKNITEGKISFFYSLITLIIGLISVLIYV